MTAEERRLLAARTGAAPWKKWGPYLSERQWGTVREDYGPTGDAWSYLSHDLARSFAYKWGEDGLAGISDDNQTLCFALALWNGRDPILKERLFGLTNREGNHGEDVKEYYYYLDSTPTHSYMRYLYRYPQRPFPYLDLVETNARRTRLQHEYELCDTGVFADDAYFDVFVEYAKAGPEDLLIEISAYNRGAATATLHLLPTLWFRNTWWNGEAPRPLIRAPDDRETVLEAHAPPFDSHLLVCEPGGTLLFADNETNPARWRDGARDARRPPAAYFKDGINHHVVDGRPGAVNPARRGTKAAAHYIYDIPPGEACALRLRLTSARVGADDDALGRRFTRVLETRRREADEFYATVIPGSLSDDRRAVMRQALAGMLWSKQFYDYDVDDWLAQHGTAPSRRGNHRGRNSDWSHMVSNDVISMPDKWEYPWYAAWDLAFHAVPLGLVDPDFAKQQILLLLQEHYMHPNGQVPASEWNFGDVNPPVHAWGAYFLYQLDKRRSGRADHEFLKAAYNKLLMNFTWWVNRKDPQGRNVFEGGFLGLDNVGVFDRNVPLPTGGNLEQADGTAWMAFFAQAMLQISLELAVEDRSYVDMALKFFEHFVWIASALVHIGGEGQSEGDGQVWNDEDGFFYDVLRTPDGRTRQLKVRSMMGLLPFCAAAVVNEEVVAALPELQRRTRWFMNHRPHLVNDIHDPRRPGYRNRRLLSLLSEDRLRRVLRRLLDEDEFLSPFGIRSLSRHHLEHPYRLDLGGQELRVGYLPADSDSAMFGGNSNWRGPVWLPLNGLLVRALINYYGYYGPNFCVECPTGSGRQLTLYEVAQEISERVARIFLLDADGRRPLFGQAPKLSDDPAWRDQLLFYEYFNGDDGAGIGASHQTGWTGLVASLLHYFATVSPSEALDLWSPAVAGAPGAARPHRRGPRPERHP
ncbi:MAG TPA: glucosidase [Polyangia bacterium]|nr:glucosidase [Polyangia bacterium]